MVVRASCAIAHGKQGPISTCVCVERDLSPGPAQHGHGWSGFCRSNARCPSERAIAAQPAFAGDFPSFRFGLAIVMRKLDITDEFGAGLLLDPPRGHIGNRVADVETLDAERLESKIVHRRDGLSHQTLVPVRFCQPEPAVTLRAIR